MKPPDDGATYEIVRWYDKDKGVPGWKRGAERPDYFKLVSELKAVGAKAILVDDMDRFSRADSMETVSDVQKLRELGVRYVHAVNQGCRDLITGGGIVTMQIAMEANASHEFSTRLSRRIAEARCDRAKDGLRSGGAAPSGMAMADINGNPVSAGPKGNGDLRGCRLLPGDPKEIKVVRWIFEQFVKHFKSLNSISGQLNTNGTLPPRRRQVVRRRRQGIAPAPGIPRRLRVQPPQVRAISHCQRKARSGPCA